MTKATSEQWADYLTLYGFLDARLRDMEWFSDGWETEFRFVEQDSPRVIFLLRKPHWCRGRIYFKTRLTNADLINRTARVGLHVETSSREDGINRVTFDGLLLTGSRELIRSWGGYVIKPTHYQKPLHVYVPFTPETLVSGLCGEFTKLHELAPIIDRAIAVSAKTKL